MSNESKGRSGKRFLENVPIDGTDKESRAISRAIAWAKVEWYVKAIRARYPGWVVGMERKKLPSLKGTQPIWVWQIYCKPRSK